AKKIIHGSKPQSSLAELAASDHLGLKRLAEMNLFTDANFSPRPDQRLPLPERDRGRIGRKLPRQQHFHLSLQKFFGCRVVRAERLCAQSCAVAEEPRGKHFG